MRRDPNRLRHLPAAALPVLFAAALAAARGAGAGEIVHEHFASAMLARDVPVTLYLPDGYRDAATSYPAVYLLHGAGGNADSWVRDAGARETLDGNIGRGTMRPTVAVMPGFGPSTWYVDAAGGEHVATAFLTELIPWVEARFKVSPARSDRAIGGFSMGGYGALSLSMSAPDRFCGAAVLSGAVYVPLPPADSAALRAPAFQRDGRFDAAAWQAQSYPARLAAYRQAPHKVAYWIASGDHDALGIAVQSAQLFWALDAFQPAQVALRITDGAHESMTWRDALPEALRWIDAQCQRAARDAPAPGR